jgi:glycosyltransferase involved in cell wall biosynthesis
MTHSTILVKGNEGEGKTVSMALSNDAISALLPVKNGEIYLEPLVPNILSMLTSNDELVVINDGSSDQTRSIIEKYCESDSRLRLINTQGIGLVRALNLGVESAAHKWIARFDVDDEYPKNRLDEERELLNDDVSVIFSDYQFISKRGVNLGPVYSAIFPLPTSLSLFSSQRTAHPSALINKRYFLQCGGYLEKDYPAEDLALWLRLSECGKLISVPKKLLLYRISGASISGQTRQIQLRKKDELISNYSLWSLRQKQCIDFFGETISSYRSTSNASERIFLHIRDIRLVSSQINVKVPYSRLYAQIGIGMSLKLAYSLLKITYFTMLRRIYRFVRL